MPRPLRPTTVDRRLYGEVRAIYEGPSGLEVAMEREDAARAYADDQMSRQSGDDDEGVIE